MKCEYSNQPRVCLMKLTLHRQGKPGFAKCEMCEHGLKAWAEANQNKNTEQEVNDMARGNCIHCGEGPYKLDGRGLCYRCRVSSNIRAQYPMGGESSSSEPTQAGDVCAARVNMSSGPDCSGHVLMVNGVAVPKLGKVVRQLGEPMITVRAGGGAIAFNAAAAGMFGIKRGMGVEFFGQAGGNLYLRLKDKPGEESFAVCRGGKSGLTVSCKVVIEAMGMKPARYAAKGCGDGIIEVEAGKKGQKVAA